MPGWARWTRRWLPVGVVLVLGTALSWLYYDFEVDEDRERVQQRISLRADWQTTAMHSVINENIDLVEGAAAFITAEPSSTQSEFKAFIDSLNSYQSVPPSRVMWLPKVSDEERESFEARVRVTGGPADYRILDIG